MENLYNNKLMRLMIFCVIVPFITAWGIFGHEHINHAAVLATPAPLQVFLYNHIDFITQESTVPDLRKHTLGDKAERPRHYINLEAFGSKDSIPRSYSDLKKKYEEVYLNQHGILPWYMELMMQRLTRAFKEKRKTEILFLAGDLGHYLADAHMPLHTTSNHDGELSGQHGIHAFWEAHLPDLYGESYNFKTDTGRYIANVQQAVWDIVFNSYGLVDSLLLTEKVLSKQFKGEVYQKNANGDTAKSKFGQAVHTSAYAQAYHHNLNGMVERQMQKAILAIASFWYTAWVDAGRPDLKDLDPQALTEENAPRLRKEKKAWNKGKIPALTSEKEF